MGEIIRRESRQLGEKYELVHHSSGLDIYVLPKKMCTAYALFATKYGSVDSVFRPAGASEALTVPDGIAHFLEHKMFENEDGEDTFAKYARFGGNANAYTTFDSTAYLFSATTAVYENLQVLLDCVTSPYFTEENVKKEQGIIAEELRMYLDNPGQTVFYALLEAMYESHPCKRRIIGTLDSIAAITPEVLYQCYRTFYHPSNMVLCISGDVETEKVLACVDRVAAIRDAAPTGEIVRCFPKEKEEVVTPLVINEAQVAQPILYIGIKDTVISPDPAVRSQKSAAVDVLTEILFGKCSDFYNTLYEQGLINGPFSPEYEHNAGYSYCVMGVESEQPELVLDRVRTYIEEVRTTGAISREAFDRAKRVLYGSGVAALDSTVDAASACLDYALEGYEMFRGFEDLVQVSYEAVQMVLKSMFAPSHIAASIVRQPEGGKQ